MRMISRLAVTVSVVLGGVACSAEDASAPHRGTGRITGSVAQVKTGAGVAGIVAVLLRDGSVLAATPTDAAGRFEFAGVPDGEYDVRLTGLELSGLSLLHTSFEPVAQTVQLAGGAVDVVFAAVGLVPARVVGTVSCGGMPRAEVSLRVVGGDADRTVSTNEQGRYAATDLADGHYVVLVTADPPGCAFAEHWAVTELRAGQSATVDFGG